MYIQYIELLHQIVILNEILMQPLGLSLEIGLLYLHIPSGKVVKVPTKTCHILTAGKLSTSALW